MLKLNRLILFAAIIVPCYAEEKPINFAERAESIVVLESQIAQREKRLSEWAREILALDARIEKQVDELVNLIAGMKDSNDSRSKVNQLKKEAIDGLQNGIALYTSKRRKVAELIRQGDATALGDLDVFDDRIIKRIDQIAKITKSIPTHQDVEKYESEGGSYWNGYYNENVRINDEWKSNRRNTGTSDLVRKETIKTLEADIDKLDHRRRQLEDSVKNRQLKPEELELYKRDLGKIDAYEDHLNRTLREVISNTTTGDGKNAVGMDQAIDIIHMVEDARSDLREDVSTLFNNYDRLLKGRAYLDSLRVNLEARKKWMEKNAPSSDVKK